MTKHLSKAEIEAVFASMDLPLIERGIEEIQDAKERFGTPEVASERAVIVQRLIVSNGTGWPPKDEKKHAKCRDELFLRSLLWRKNLSRHAPARSRFFDTAAPQVKVGQLLKQ